MEDLIRRQAALDILDDFQSNIELGIDDYAEKRKALCDLPSADRPRWIPCSKRLPRYDETDEMSEYLVTDKGGRVRHCYLDPYMPETFVTVEEGMIVDAVAWRPAPEPWRGDKNE